MTKEPEPPGLQPPPGLRWFNVIFVVMILTALARLINGSVPESTYRDAMAHVMSAWLMMTGTVYALQPGRRKIGYFILTSAILIVILQAFVVGHR